MRFSFSLQAASNSLLMQREAGQNAQPSQGQTAMPTQQQQPKWPAGGASAAAVSSEQLSLELHQVEREIGMRTREMAMVRGACRANSGFDKKENC